MGFEFQYSEGVNPMTRVNFKSLIQTVLDYAPSDATGEALIQRSEEGPYRASIQIHCANVEISCRRSASSASALLQSVKNELFGQIRTWRENRDFEAQAAVM